MLNSKLHKIRLLSITAMIFLFIACSSTSIDENSTLMDGPEWLRKPPLSSELIYGIGCAEDEKTAKELALVNAAQQFSTHVKSELILLESDCLGDRASILKTFDEQITDYTLKGAKFVEKYVDHEGQTWLLVEAPLNCLLDGTESILISHILTSEYIFAEESPDDLTTARVIRDFRENLKDRIGDSVTQMLQSEDIVEQIIETGYVNPGYLISYSANKADGGKAPVDSNLYSSGDLIYIPGNSGRLTREGRSAFGWTTESDGSGIFYREGSLLSIEEGDVVLYAQYVMNEVSVPTGYTLNQSIAPQNRTIELDGEVNDWVDIASLDTDRLNDSKTDQSDDIDIAAVYYAIDEDFIYIMLRSTSAPLPEENISYEFHFLNRQQNNKIKFMLFRDSNTSKEAETRIDGSFDAWPAMSSGLLYKYNDVLEIAIPLDILKRSPLYTDNMEFVIAVRKRDSQELIDETQHLNIQF